MDRMAHQRKKLAVTKPSHTPMTSGPREQPKGQRRKLVGPLGGRPACPWAPPPSVFDVSLPDWFLKSVQWVSYWFPGRAKGSSPLYIWREGLHFKHLTIQQYHFNPRRDVVSFSCRGLRTRGVRVRVVVRGLRVFMESPVCLLPSLYTTLWVCTRCLFIYSVLWFICSWLCMWSFLWVMIVLSDSYA